MLKLENKEEAFVVRYDGRDFDVPAGKFEVEEDLGNHILMTAHKWEKKVEVIGGRVSPKGQAVENKPEQPRPIGGPAKAADQPGITPKEEDNNPKEAVKGPKSKK